jgi:Cellulose biosynthesis protein BcsS
MAHALDLPPPDSPETPITPKIQHVGVDASVVATSLRDGSANVNGTFAPFGDINDSGVRIRLTGGYSWYRFITGENPLTFGSGHTLEGGLLAGYQLSMERVSFVGLIGPSIAESSDEITSKTQWGAKTVLSMYALPSAQTMAYASLSYSTIGNAVQFQSKVGLRVVSDFYVGPEAAFSWFNEIPSSNNIAVMRIGGHVSAVTFGPAQIGVSGGWAHQQKVGSGYYGGINFFWTF